ncbi:MAG TPA: Calx-beta domain-containing protein, partial [Kofleriaceae bacterium]|nr:Calx-beta domain-containing protein [Kofleriaceae bacterium]
SPLTIAAGQTSTTITIAMVEDALDEDNETVIVDLDVPTNALPGATMKYTLTITDDDALPQVSFSGSDGSAAEGTTPPGPNSIDYTYTLTLNAVSGRTVTVPILYTGTATMGTDYSGPASVSFPPNTTTADLTITVNKDSDIEVNETIIMTIDGTNVVNATAKTPLVRTHTINNDD